MKATSGPMIRGAFYMLAIVAVLIAVGYFWWLPASDREVRFETADGLITKTALDFSTVTPTRFERVPEGTPKNLVILIGDGMGFSQLTSARMALLGPNGRLTIERFPITGWTSTHSETEVYTDSAAGATALATGTKTERRRISTGADDQSLETLFEKAQAAGKSVGAITDSMMYDATPAAFMAHRASRREYLGIAEDVLALGPQVLLGETRLRFEESPRWKSLFEAYEAAGYHRMESAEDLKTAPEGKILGLFSHGSIAEGRPDLSELTTFALDRLGTSEEGFVLLVETEETDSGAHNHDFERMVQGVAALDRVAEVVMAFARERGDTLVVATADHETGGLSVLAGPDGEPQRIRWTTDGHTAEPVPLLAYGPGSEAFSGVHDNAEVGLLLARTLFAPL